MLDAHAVVVALGSLALAAAMWAFINEWMNVSRRSKALAHLPGPEYGLIGMLPSLWKKDFHRQITLWANEHGPVMKMRIMQFHAIIITDPALATHVCRSKLLDKMRFQYHFLDQFLGGINLLTGPTDAHWKAVRKGVAPAFSAGCMKAAFAHVVERCQFLASILDSMGEETPVNVDDLLLRESMDVIGRVGFQKEMGALQGLKDRLAGGADDVGSYVRTMLECTHEIENRLKEPHRAKFLWKPSVRAGHRLMDRWKAIVRDNLLQHIKDVVPVKGSFADLLSKVVDPKTGAGLTDDKLLPEIAALFFAGTDTTGHTGTWCLYLLSQHPAAEAAALEELAAAGLAPTAAAPTPRPLEYADLAKLPYLQAVIKETLRLYPPVGAGQVRVSSSDITLAGGRLHVPAGTMLWVPHHSLHNTVHNWGDDVKEFKPERWLAPGAEYAGKLPMPASFYEGWYDASLHTDAALAGTDSASGSTGEDDGAAAGDKGRAKRYMPFAEGPRNCVGQSLAKVSLVATMASLLPKFKFVLDGQMGGAEGVDGREQYTLVTGIDGGMWMRATRRPLPPAAAVGTEGAPSGAPPAAAAA